MEQKNIIEISWGSLWRIFIFILIGVALFSISEILLVIYLAIVISLALHSIVDYLERFRIPRLLGTIVIFAGFIALVALVVRLVVPMAIGDLKSLIAHLHDINLFGFSLPTQIGDEIVSAFSNLPNFLTAKGFSVVQMTSSFAGGLALAFATLLMTFYLTLSRNGVEMLIRQILPSRYEGDFLNIFSKAKTKIGLWLQAQIILSMVMGVLVFIGLWVLGVKYALILGILAGLFEIVPLVGPIFSGAMAFLVAISQSPELGLYTILLFIVIQQTESHLIIPLFMGKTIDTNPVVILAALLIGGKLAGLIGAILAVPTTVIIQEWFNYWVEKKK